MVLFITLWRWRPTPKCQCVRLLQWLQAHVSCCLFSSKKCKILLSLAWLATGSVDTIAITAKRYEAPLHVVTAAVIGLFERRSPLGSSLLVYQLWIKKQANQHIITCLSVDQQIELKCIRGRKFRLQVPQMCYIVPTYNAVEANRQHQ